MLCSPALLALSALPLALGLVAQAPYERGECTTRVQRKSWSTLTEQEKHDYLQADLCLMATPPKSGIKGAQSRWDELQYAHVSQVDYIHGVGAFLPFHRYFVTAHGHLLQAECNYTGPLPYWDEPADMGAINASALFNGPNSFGGNGTGAAACVADGPFANLTLHLKEDGSVKEGGYCVARVLNDFALAAADPRNVEVCRAKTSFVDAWKCYEGMPHSAGHGGVMGTMINLFLSPGDPVFYLHHGYLDKLWWDWQAGDLPARLADMGGNNTAAPFVIPPGGFNFTGFPPFGGNGSFPGNFTVPPGFPPVNGTNGTGQFPGFGMNHTVNKAFTAYFNDGGNVTTLNHTLWSADILANVTIGDVMDPRQGFVCAEYL
ncbi:Di-copper centre-containing protein [Xylariomycetidae sp. FL0641]|nr:Di-copper centre-containing protein [Xylariomycetidae sp. FL0641]